MGGEASRRSPRSIDAAPHLLHGRRHATHLTSSHRDQPAGAASLYVFCLSVFDASCGLDR